MTSTVRAVVQTADRTLEVSDIPRPSITPGEALMRVEASGMCGSDVEQYEGRLAAVGLKYPVVPGHEPIGVIEEIGPEASSRWGVTVGDRVAVEPVLGCGSCANCLTGLYRRCLTGIPGSSINSYGYVPATVGSGLWGGYAELMHLHPRTVVHRIDPELPIELAALYQPMAAGIRWFTHETGLTAGDSVLVLGCGPRGLAGVVAARNAGAGQIIVTGLTKDAHRLALALELGADATADVEKEDTVTRVRELTGGRGVDIAVDVSAVATQPILDAVDAIRAGGTIVIGGIKGAGRTVTLTPDVLAMREITLRGVFSADIRAFAPALRLLESRRYPLEKLHTHTFGMGEVDRAIDVMAGRVPGEGAVHIMVTPS